jgi:hypothetical protein
VSVRRVCSRLAFVTAAWVGCDARAQGNYRSTPTGGRSALLGDTGVALGGDGSAPFLNPATIVRIRDANLAFSVNFFSFTANHFSSWHEPGPVDTQRFGALSLPDTSTSNSRFELIPSTLCVFFTVAGWGDPNDEQIAPDARFLAPRSGRQKLAACFGTTEQQTLSLPALAFKGAVPGGATQSAQSVDETWRRFHVGPSYAIDVTEDLSLGVSIHGVFTSYGMQRASSAITSDAAGRPVASALDASASGRTLALDARVGATWRLEPLTFGLTVKPPSLHLFGSYDAALHRQSITPDASAAQLATGSGDLRAPIPASVGLGVAAHLGRLRFEIDGTYYFPLDAALATSLHVDATTMAGGAVAPSSAELTSAARARGTVNGAAGVEYFVAPALSVLGGLATDLTSTADLPTDTSIGALHASRLSRVLLSFGIGSYGTAGTVLIGTQLSYGWGQTIAVNPYAIPNAYATVDTQTYGAMLVLAGSTNLRAVRGAVESVQEIVRPK